MSTCPEASKLKHYCRQSYPRLNQPTLLFGINLNLQDVRSGHRDSSFFLVQAEWLSERRLDWTDGMVCRVEEDCLEEIHPPSPLSWPSFSDEKIIHFLTQRYRPKIWQNRALGIYSDSKETKAEFVIRCKEKLLEERSEEKKKLWDVFIRRFLELEENILEELVEEVQGNQQWEKTRVEKVKQHFSTVRDTLWSLREKQWSVEEETVIIPASTDVLVSEKPTRLIQDLSKAYADIEEACKLKSEEIEHYEISVLFSQMEVVSRGIVWGPIVEEGGV